MTGHPKNSPEQTSCEKPKENGTIGNFAKSLKLVSGNYSKSLGQKCDPQKTKEIAIRQLKELQATIDTYKKSSPSNNQDLKKIEDTIRFAQIFLDGWANKEDIMKILLSPTKKMINEEKDALNNILVFLPDEYKENGQLSEAIKKDLNKYKFQGRMNEFISGKRKKIPIFDNDEFNSDRAFIIQALKKPGAILSWYEFYSSDSSLSKNPEFIKILNEILAVEYPDFFGEAQKEKWYTEGRASFEKISILLEIKKDKISSERDFIKMMNLTNEENDMESLDRYDKDFRGKNIGYQIQWYFPNAPLIWALKENVLKTINRSQYKGDLASLLSNNANTRELAKETFVDIPPETLSLLLKKLQICETTNPMNRDTILKIIDTDDNIDNSYKIKFFSGLFILLSLKKKIDSDILYNYRDCIIHYIELSNVDEEKKLIAYKETEDEFSMINKLFPWTENTDIRKQKNREFKNFLDDSHIFNSDGVIWVNTSVLIERLWKIFEWSEEAKHLMDAIRKSKDGKEVFGLLAEGFKEVVKNTENRLEWIGFDVEKWNGYKNSNPKEYLILRQKLGKNSPLSRDDKFTLLGSFTIGIKVPKDPKRRKEFIENTLSLLDKNEQANKGENTYYSQAQADFSASWKSGDFTTFNQKSQEREQKKEAEAIKKQEEREQSWEKDAKAIPVKSYDNIVSLSKNFTEIETGKVITYKIGNSDVFIKKDSKDEISIFSGGIPIRQIKITDEKNPQEDINKAMNSIQFFKNSGLSIFGSYLPKMIEIINNKLVSHGKEKLNFSDGLKSDGSEGEMFLRYISAVVDPQLSTGDILKNFQTLSARDGWLLSKLQNKAWYVTNNSLNMTTIFSDLEKVKI